MSGLARHQFRSAHTRRASAFIVRRMGPRRSRAVIAGGLLAGFLTVGCAGPGDDSALDAAGSVEPLCTDLDAVRQLVERVGDVDLREDGIAGLATAFGDVLDDLVVLHASGRDELGAELSAIDAVEQEIRSTVDEPALHHVAGVLGAAASLAETTSTLIERCG